MGETEPGIYDIIESRQTRDRRTFVQLSTRPPVVAGELVLDLRGADAAAREPGAVARVFADGRAEVRDGPPRRPGCSSSGFSCWSCS